MLLPVVASADAVEIGGIYYNVIPKGKVAEVTRNPNKYSGSVVIPETVDYNGVQCSVTSIGQYAFFECSSLTSVTIPNSVTSIGYHAFYRCLGLKEVHISDIAAWCKIEFNKNDSNPLEYAHHLYLNGEEIKDLIIPDSVTEIKNSAFSGCSGLTSVTIGNSVTSIGESAFKYCSGLMSVIIPNSVSSIGIAAFNGSGLTSVTIPNSVTSIGNYAFGSCSSLKEVNYNATNCTYMGSYYNPVFFDNPSSINVINIADNVQIIPANAFYGCGGLTSVTIGKSVNSIGGGAFSNCSSLKEVHISDIAAWCKIEFDQGYSNPLIYAHHLYLNGEEIKDLIIPNSVTEIKKSAFSGCSGLTSVTIANGVTSIGNSAFQNCSGLTSVTIPNSVSNIGGSAFRDCI